MPLTGARPEWLTFDCYGTLIQWDEGLLEAVTKILARHGKADIEAGRLIQVYDRHEHRLEQEKPHRSFREVSGSALRSAMEELGLAYASDDTLTLTSNISKMPPFPEVVETLASLKAAGFKLCIISNTDDDIIAGNLAQLGGHIDRVISAEQAGAYKPSRQIFEHAHGAIGTTRAQLVHICASPHLDLAAARDLGFRAIWINRGSERRPLPDYRPDAEFPRLDGVVQCFRSLGWM